MKALDIVNQTEAHLVAQGVKALRSWGRERNQCAYRGDNGTKCGVGFWIDDPHYATRIEGMPATDPDVFNLLPWIEDVSDAHLFWERLQNALHDSTLAGASFVTRVRAGANRMRDQLRNGGY